jgi:hypothetical protein
MRHDQHKQTALATDDRNHGAMPMPAELPDLDYDPGRLLDVLRSTMRLKNDAALARTLGLSPPVISKIRHQQIPVGPSTLLRMHEVTELSIAHLRELMGDRRKHFRIGAAPVNLDGSAGRQ